MFALLLLLAPHEQARFRALGCQRIERGLMRTFIEKFGQRFLFGAPYVDGFAIDDLAHVRRRIVHVADQNRLRRAQTTTHAGSKSQHRSGARRSYTSQPNDLPG